MVEHLEWITDTPRLFDLGLRSRTVDHVAKTVTLECASDEALLTDYAALVEDTGATTMYSSLRDVVDYVLDKIGASLAPGGPDAPIPLDDPPEVLIWKAGISAWDFLQPLCTLAGFRLFCDELRVWRLIDPATYDVPGYVPVTPDSAIEGVDTISRDDGEVFATGVVTRWAWEDFAGVAHTQTDSAGTPEKVVVFDYARPYPGPGTAAAILGRRNGTGRVQDVSGLARWQATPGMVASIQLPGAEDQLGKVSGVEWALDDTSLMRLTTRTLFDRVPGSWLDWDQLQAWEDVDPAITWESLAT